MRLNRTLEDRLTYCKLCQNQKFSFERGIFCGISQQKPDFKNHCPDFDEDTTLRYKKAKELRDRLAYTPPGSRGKQEVGDYYYPTNDKRVQKYLETAAEEYQINKSRLTPWISMLFLITVLTLIWTVGLNIPHILLSVLLSIVIVISLIFQFGLMIDAYLNPGVGHINAEELAIGNTVVPIDQIFVVLIKSTDNQKFLSLRLLGRAHELNIDVSSFSGLSLLITHIEVYRLRNKSRQVSER